MRTRAPPNTAATSRNGQTGRITPPSTKCRLCGIPHNRHTVASRALLAGESVDEIAFLLGHRDANVTRAVYVRELSDARRRTMRRSRMIAEFSDVLGAQDID
jgi:integrase